MRHLAGFFEDVDQAAASGLINGMPDTQLVVAGDNVQVPAALPFVGGLAVITAATTLTSAQLQSPSLRTIVNMDISPMANAATMPNPPANMYFPNNPHALVGIEDLNFQTVSDHAAAIEIYGLVWLQDGPIQPVDGEIFTLRHTAGITLVDGIWTNGNLTSTQVLPVGTYDVVGMRAEGTGLVAARLAFVGGTWRPGVFGRDAIGEIDDPLFRFGKSGVWGSFDHTTPPSLDAVGATGTAQVIYLDLIKTG